MGLGILYVTGCLVCKTTCVETNFTVFMSHLEDCLLCEKVLYSENLVVHEPIPHFTSNLIKSGEYCINGENQVSTTTMCVDR